MKTDPPQEHRSGPTVAQVVTLGRRLGLPRLEVQMLLLHVLGHATHDRAWLLAHDDDQVEDHAIHRFRDLGTRRLAGEPMAYLTGQKEFHGLTLSVDARVLDPRPDTETLVDWALDLMPADKPQRVLDLGTGSGAVALALAHARPQAEVWATDTSADALAVAQDNAGRLGLKLTFRHGDWLAAVTGERFDLIVSNPPYIAENDAHLASLSHEPQLALVSGIDGLEALRTIIATTPSHLTPGGWLLLEHGWDQASHVRSLLHATGLGDITSRSDLAGVERCSGGRQSG